MLGVVAYVDEDGSVQLGWAHISLAAHCIAECARMFADARQTGLAAQRQHTVYAWPPCTELDACLHCKMSRAADLAQYMAKASTLHPAFRQSSMLYGMEMGGWEDPTTQVRSPHLQLQHCPS